MKYSFGSMAAQAVEIMSALLQGNLVHWVDTRGPGGHVSGKEFDLYFCGLEDDTANRYVTEKRNHRKEIKLRLKGLSESLSGYILDTLELQYEDTMVDDIRFARFILKHQSKSSVTVLLNFEKGFEGASKMWGPWQLCGDSAVVCKVHPDERFHGETILWSWGT